MQAALLGVFYFPWLSGAQTFFYKDCTHFFEPLCTFIGRALAEGRLPLWNPYAYGGMPEVAISSPGICYPLNWIFACTTYSVGVAVIMIISQLVCGAGCFLLIESLGWGAVAAVVGAVIVANSGYMFALAHNYTLVATAAWFPWCLLAVRNIIISGGRTGRSAPTPIWWTVGLGLLVFMFVAAGRPEIMAPGMVLVAAYAGWLIYSEPSYRNKDTVLNLCRGLFIGLLLSMPVILPSLEWLSLSRRSAGLDPDEILMFSANWFDLACMFVFQPLGDLQLMNAPQRHLVYPNNLEPYFQSAFVGPVALLLAVIGLVRGGKGRRTRAYWLAVLALFASVIFALGSNVPGMEAIVQVVPGFSLLRFPSKLLFFTVFFIALFAARGVALWPVLSTYLLVPIVLIGTLMFNAFAYLHKGGPADYFSVPSAVAGQLRRVASPMPVFDLRFAGLFLERFTAPRAEVEDPFQFTVDTTQYSRQLLRPFTNMDCRLPSSFGFEGAMVGEYFYLFSNCYVKSTQALPRPDEDAQRTDAPLARLLRLMATPFVVSQDYRYLNGIPTQIRPLESQFFDLVWTDPKLNARISAVKNPLPRAYLTYNWTRMNRDEIIERIYDDNSKWDPSDLTLLERTQDGLEDAQSHRARERVSVEEVTPEKIICRTESNAAGILVLSDQYYPGWSATVDGNAVPIIRCNGFVRAVKLEQGNHVVEFKYEPRSFYGGLILALLGLIWSAYLAIRTIRNKHHS